MPIKLFIDFETYYDTDYSLRKMTPIEYVLDPRFEMIGCAVAIDDGTPKFLDDKHFRALLARLDPADTIAIAHNALFDMLILVLRYGFEPSLMVDTMGMCRMLKYYRTGRVSLEVMSRELGLPEKGKALAKVIGMRAKDIQAADLWLEFAAYAVGDVVNCRGIFKALRSSVPRDEWLVMDMVIRCAVMPSLVADENLLAEHLAQVQADKQALLDRVGLAPETLQSNDKFAQALITLGVDPPRKTSLKTGKETWAFARSDKDFQALVDDDNPEVQALMAARLGIKSTLEESRTERFLNISRLEWPAKWAGKSWMPIPLKFSGAHTHRFSGDWQLNMQNLPGRKGTKALRRSLRAPPGYAIVAVDASQIEARLNAWISGEQKLLQLFRDKGDPYLDFAMKIYRRQLTKADKVERFLGKTSILGLGYGMGGAKFFETVRIQSVEQGIEIDMTPWRASEIVYLYRDTYQGIRTSWGKLDALIPLLAREPSFQTFGPGGAVVFLKERIRIPASGLPIHYHNIQNVDGQWRYNFGREVKTLYGGKCLENIIQHLASVVIRQAAVRVYKKTRLRFVHQIHDELLYVVPQSDADWVKDLVVAEMSVEPEWAPGAPLSAEGKIGENYGEME